MENFKQLDKDYIVNTYNRNDLLLVNGKGVYCYDENDKEYIDFTSGIGVNSLGFSHKQWVESTTKQLSMLQHTSNLYYTKPNIELAKKLCDKTAYKKVFFANSGAEANEGAIKIARKYSFLKYPQNKNRNKILTLVNSFHGRTITTLSATGQDVFHNYFFPFNDGFDYVIANNIESLNEKINDNVCGIMIEFVQGEGGVIPLDKNFVNAIVNVCEKNDILLIADEVQTGIGRAGKLLCSSHYNCKPNITTLAKGLGNGLPIGAILTDAKTENTFTYSDHGTTFGGNPVACSGANVVLDVLNDDLLSRVDNYFSIIKNKLIPCKQVESVDGLGLMIGVKLKDKKAIDVLKQCQEKGLLVLTAKEKIRLLPPLVINEEELLKGLDILIEVINM